MNLETTKNKVKEISEKLRDIEGGKVKINFHQSGEFLKIPETTDFLGSSKSSPDVNVKGGNKQNPQAPQGGNKQNPQGPQGGNKQGTEGTEGPEGDGPDGPDGPNREREKDKDGDKGGNKGGEKDKGGDERKFNVGDRVKTPDGIGVITGFNEQGGVIVEPESNF